MADVTRLNCDNCARPLASDADHDPLGCRRCSDGDATCPHAALCWSLFGVRCEPPPWRESALQAKRLVAALRGDEVVNMLAMAARGELPVCHECERLATRRWIDAPGWVCDACVALASAEDIAALEDLPHAPALRAAMEVTK